MIKKQKQKSPMVLVLCTFTIGDKKTKYAQSINSSDPRMAIFGSVNNKYTVTFVQCLHPNLESHYEYQLGNHSPKSSTIGILNSPVIIITSYLSINDLLLKQENKWNLNFLVGNSYFLVIEENIHVLHDQYGCATMSLRTDVSC